VTVASALKPDDNVLEVKIFSIFVLFKQNSNLNDPLKTHETNSPGRPLNLERVSITKYGINYKIQIIQLE
jgi:hypothetical protein